MKNIELNRNNVVPKYFLIEEDILKQIKNNELKPHDRVFSEVELCSKYKISKITARKALEDLTYKGILYRIQGKGTFVSAPKIETGSSKLTSFTEEIKKRGLKPNSIELERKLIIPEEKIIKDLNLDKDDKTIVIKRLRYADGVPMGIQTCFLPYKRFYKIYDDNLMFDSIYQCIEEVYQIKIKNAFESYQAININKHDAKYLDVKKDDAALLVYRITYDDKDQVIECVESIMRADRYIVIVNLQR